MGDKTKLLVLSLFIAGLLLAKASSAETQFTWQNYVGTTQWSVQVTDNEGNCGAAGPTTSTQSISITHNFEIADVGDYGHGVMRGTFTNNALHIPEHTISDPPGNSKLAAFDIIFSNDCMSFMAEYDWDYSGPDQSCSGSTEIKGTRTDGTGCPTPGGMTETTTPGATSDEEQSLLQKLANNPDDFWANWQMAELKKQQGDASAFFDYFNKAIANMDPETRQKLKDEELKQLHLSDFPTRATSPILRVGGDEVDSWNGGWVSNINVPQEETNNKDAIHFLFWTINAPNTKGLINQIVGVQ